MAYEPSNPSQALPDTYPVAATAQSAVVGNVLVNPASSTPLNVEGFKSFSVQVVSTGTAGTFIFEGSNDGTNFQTAPVFNQAVATGSPIVAAITATNSQIIYVGSIQYRYMRLRIASTITGGSITPIVRLSQTPFAPNTMTVAQATASNLATQATIQSGTVTTVTTLTSMTSGNLAIPGIIADVASAALTTTTTTATLTPTFGVSYVVNVPVTVVSGTNPTLDIQVQESSDTGTNWYAVYDFPRITATGSYISPPLTFRGNRIRYVQTVGGTTPSFTRAVNRLQMSLSPAAPLVQQVNRTINLESLGSATPALLNPGCKNAQMTINIGAVTGAPSIQLQGSDDAGTTWYDIGSPLLAVASSTVSLTVPNVTAQAIRAEVSTAGTGVTPGYVLVRGF